MEERSNRSPCCSKTAPAIRYIRNNIPSLAQREVLFLRTVSLPQMTDLRNLRRLAKKYHIRFRLPSEPWPESHADTFKNIEELGSYRFETYAQNVNIRSAEEPWTLQTKSQ